MLVSPTVFLRAVAWDGFLDNHQPRRFPVFSTGRSFGEGAEEQGSPAEGSDQAARGYEPEVAGLST